MNIYSEKQKKNILKKNLDDFVIKSRINKIKKNKTKYKTMELTAEQINEHIDKFVKIYDDNGNQVNPVPTDKKVTVWCESNIEQGFACNVTVDEMGIEILIARSWIYEDELQELCKNG